MGFEADTTQDILKRCFNVSLSTLQVTLKGGAAISLGAVRILGTASAVMQGTTTYGFEVDVQRLPNNVSPNISSIQNNISVIQNDISLIQVDASQMQAAISNIEPNISSMQDDIFVMQPDVSLARAYMSTMQTDISSLQDDVSLARAYLSVVQPDVSIMQVDTSQIQQNLSSIQTDISVMQNDTSQIKGYASTFASAIVNENVSRVRIADTWTTGVHGVRSTISTVARRIAHGTSTALKRGMLCRAHRNNTTMLYVGFAGVTGEATASTCGHPLAANQSFLIEANNSFSPYAIANAVAQKLHYFGI